MQLSPIKDFHNGANCLKMWQYEKSFMYLCCIAAVELMYKTTKVEVSIYVITIYRDFFYLVLYLKATNGNYFKKVNSWT